MSCLFVCLVNWSYWIYSVYNCKYILCSMGLPANKVNLILSYHTSILAPQSLGTARTDSNISWMSRFPILRTKKILYNRSYTGHPRYAILLYKRHTLLHRFALSTRYCWQLFNQEVTFWQIQSLITALSSWHPRLIVRTLTPDTHLLCNLMHYDNVTPKRIVSDHENS